MTAPDAASARGAEGVDRGQDRLAWVAHLVDERAAMYEDAEAPMPNTASNLRADAQAVRLAAAVVAAARAWAHSGEWGKSSIELLDAVNAYEAALPGGRG